MRIRNTFNIIRSIGFLFFGIGVFMTSITLPDFIERLQYHPDTLIYRGDNIYGFVLLGIVLVIVGFSGILKLKWFPIGGIIALIGGFIAGNWLFYQAYYSSASREIPYILVAAFITFWVFIISMILLMRNEYFLKALKEEAQIRRAENEILDDWD